MKLSEINSLKKKAKNLRIKTFLEFIKKGEAHLGGSFSMIEILLTLYEKILKKNDKFVLSKSHSSFPLCILLNEKGFKNEITTHLEIDEKNGINCTTGSLGHGLPISTGMAFSRKIQKKGGNIYVMISDGECQEGTTWESLLIATKHKLKNLKAQKLLQKGKIKEFHSIISEIIRSYINIRFNYNALETTTKETINALKLKIDKKTIENLELILSRSDLAKYAKIEPRDIENQESFDLANKFINLTKEIRNDK